ncbi:hypothetical protein F5X97DRAFT_308336 [Nemania serpens]|nr:hypothetical protein F5X97DRAFT_308336 [Nemania serpens]
MTQHTQLKERLSQRISALAAFRRASQVTKDSWVNEFLERYTEPHRQYHDVTHIDAMLACYDDAAASLDDDEAVILAIIFHDWVYDPLRRDNEAESARVFESFAEDAAVAAETRRTVRDLIEATTTHTPRDEDEDERTKLFLDFDLEVLSRPREAYWVYAAQIRGEYGAFDDEAFGRGRTAVLEGFLRREKIYFSDAFAEREQCARENIQAEIARLKSLGGGDALES